MSPMSSSSRTSKLYEPYELCVPCDLGPYICPHDLHEPYEPKDPRELYWPSETHEHYEIY